ncbi:PD-(D/E)XK nuclease family protein [bacterium]|nr:PD-(D/E)XK nuclease family protein [bacterium]
MINNSKLHTGLLHCDLEPALIAEIQTLKSIDPLDPIVVLIGSRLLADYLGWRFVEKGFNLFNVRFITFADLTNDLSFISRINDSRPLMPPHGEFLFLLDAVSNLKKPHYFDKVSGRFSFIRILKASFSDLDEALIDEIEELVSKPLDNNDKFTVLANLRSLYQDNVSQFQRPQDNLISSANPGKSFKDAYKTDHLIIYGFYDFNTAQRGFLESLVSEIELNVYLPWCEGDVTGSAFQFAQPTVNFFSKILPDSHVGASLLNPSLVAYGHRLFNFGIIEESDKETPQEHNLIIFNASDQAAEVRSIVGRINEAVLYNEIPLSHIGIILWQPDNYLPLLKHEMGKANLPFYDAIGITLAQTAECRAFLSLLRMCGKPIERQALVDLIASYKLNLSVTNKNVCSNDEIEPDPVAWEAISIETGIVEGDLQKWITQLDYLANRAETKTEHQDKSPFISREQITLFKEFVEALSGRFSEIPDNVEWDKYVDNAVKLAKEFLPANDNTDQIIETMQSTFGLAIVDHSIDRANLTSIITELFKKTKIAQSGRYRVDGITICDKMTSRGVSFDLLFIPGLTQGSVPAKLHDDPFLNDRDRIILNKVLFKQDYSTTKLPLQLPLKSSMLDEERLLFALAVDSAEKRLCLSYPDHGADGRKLLPSRFLLEMCRIVTGKPVETDKISELEFFEDDSKLSQEKRIEKLERRAVDEKQFVIDKLLIETPDHLRPEVFKQVYSKHSEQFQRGIKAAIQRITGENFTAWDGVMPEGWSQPQLIPTSFSASALEAYAGCPFAYFISHILKASEWEEPEMLFEPPPQAIGSLVHGVLERFFLNARDEGKLPLTGDNRDWAESELESILAKNIKRIRVQHPAPRALWDIEEQRTLRRLKAFLKAEIDAESDFNFIDAEVTVKQELTLKTDTVLFTFNLTGKIDRIDRSSNGKSIRIIDYKTGNKPSKPEDFKSGTNLQLPLYLMAIIARYPDVELNESSAEYLHIGTEGNIKSLIMRGTWLSENETELGKIVRVLISSIRAGLFPAIPEKTKCSNCSAQYLCDFRSRKSFEYKRDDNRLDGLREIGLIE